MKRNFNNSIQPLKYKLSSLIGDLYRCSFTTTTEKDLNNAIKDMEKNLSFKCLTKKIIQPKISELKNRNLQLIKIFEILFIKNIRISHNHRRRNYE